MACLPGWRSTFPGRGGLCDEHLPSLSRDGGSRGARRLGAWWGGAGGCFAGRGRICYREAADPGRYRGLAYVRVAE
jgi:hypothetical protein